MTLEPSSIHLASLSNRRQWDDYVLSHPEGLAYQLYAWQQAVNQAYGFKGHYLYALQQGRICGVLPLIELKVPLCRSRLISLPYCDAAAVLADSPQISQALVDFALQYMQGLNIQEIELRSSGGGELAHWNTPALQDQEAGNNFSHHTQAPNISHNPIHHSPSTHKVRLLLQLPQDSKTLLQSFKSKVRSQILKPQRDGLQFEMGSLELLDQFYWIYTRNMHQLGSPVHSKSWFSSLLAAYQDRAWIGLSRLPDGSPAAAGMILLHQHTVSLPWASAVREYNRWNPNMLLYWGLMQYAADNGYAWFDFGRSTPGEGTYKFKTQWGAKPKELFWLQCKLQQGPGLQYQGRLLSQQGQDSSLRKWAEKGIMLMPQSVNDKLGSRLRKYISL